MFTIPELERAAAATSCELILNGRGHWVLRRGGQRPVHVAATPSEYRSAKNALSQMRRFGYADVAEKLATRPPKPQPSRPEEEPRMARRTVNKPPTKPAPTKGLRAAIEEVTADRARELLKGNTTNRNLRLDYVRQLTDQFVVGDVVSGVGTVLVAETGRLLDGQHRLTALLSADRVQPGITWTAVVVEGLPEEAITVVDTGKPRSLADVLKLERGEHYHLPLASALSTYHRILYRRYLAPGGSWTRWKPSNFEALRLLDETPELRDAVKKATSTYIRASRLLSPSVLASLHVMMESIEKGEGDKFMAALHTGKCDAMPQVFDLREHMTVLRDRKDIHVHPLDALRWSTLTWNAYRAGTSVTRHRLSRSQGHIDLAGFEGYRTASGIDKLSNLLDDSPAKG